MQWSNVNLMPLMGAAAAGGARAGAVILGCVCRWWSSMQWDSWSDWNPISLVVCSPELGASSFAVGWAAPAAVDARIPLFWVHGDRQTTDCTHDKLPGAYQWTRGDVDGGLCWHQPVWYLISVSHARNNGHGTRIPSSREWWWCGGGGQVHFCANWSRKWSNLTCNYLACVRILTLDLP